MKKLIVYFFSFIFICFILPAILTKQDIVASSSIEKRENISNNTISEKENKQVYEYKNYKTIKLLHKENGEIEEIELDKYLINVVSAEMPVSYHIEALKAQAVVARTYTIYKIQNKKHYNADICDDSACCQAWISKEDRFARWEESERENNWKKIEQCVYDTAGEIITYDSKPINAFFHANSGGKTELPVNVWGGGTGLPYLQVVETLGEEGYTQYSSEVILKKDELIEKVKTKHVDIIINFDNEEEIKIIEYTESGRVKTVKIGNYEFSGVEIRTLLGLRSTNFEITREEDRIKFIVKGYGHGVGMSQTGADTKAKQGNNYKDIIKHFYVGVEIKLENELL